MRRPVSMLLALLVLACAVLGYQYVQQKAEVTRLRGEVEAARAAGGQQVEKLRQELAKAQVSDSQVQLQARAATPAPAHPVVPFTIPPAGPPAVQSARNPTDDMKKVPAMADLLRKQERRTLFSRYGEVFAAMNLPPDQLAKLKNLVLDQQEAPTDARDAALRAGIQDGTPEMAKAQAQAASQVAKEVQALLGADGYAQFQQLAQESTMKRIIEGQVGLDLADAGAPLSAEQLTTLSKIYAGVQDPQNNPEFVAMMRQPPDLQTGLTALDQAIIERAAPFLSAPQLKILRQSLVDQRQQQLLTRQMTTAPNVGSP